MPQVEDYALFLKFLKSQDLQHYAEVLFTRQFNLTNFDKITRRELVKLGITSFRSVQSILDAVNVYGEHKERILRQLIAHGHISLEVEGTKKQENRASKLRREFNAGKGPVGPLSVDTLNSTEIAANISSSAADVRGQSTDPDIVGAHTAVTAAAETGHAHPQPGKKFRDQSSHPREKVQRSFTATLPTSSECARKAQTFLDHQRVSRGWPLRETPLATFLQLSGLSGKSKFRKGKGLNEIMYKIVLDSEKKPGRKVCTSVSKQDSHRHGTSARYCTTCADHNVDADGNFCVWQYRTTMDVDVGGVMERVETWKNFSAKDCLRLEVARLSRNATLIIKQHVIDLELMLWKNRPIRRYPSLRTVDFPVSIGAKIDQTIQDTRREFQQRGTAEIHTMFLLLHQNSEETSRLELEEEENIARMQVADTIEVMVMHFFSSERAQLRELESEERTSLEDDIWNQMYNKNGDGLLWKWKQYLLNASLEKSQTLMSAQCTKIGYMEFEARRFIQTRETIHRENLGKLLAVLQANICKVIRQEEQEQIIFGSRATRGSSTSARSESSAHAHTKINPLSAAGAAAWRRCEKCRRVGCAFFCQPWANNWKRRGMCDVDKGDNGMSAEVEFRESLSGLVGRARRLEYLEYLNTQRLLRSHSKWRKKLRDFKQDRKKRRNGDPITNRGYIYHGDDAFSHSRASSTSSRPATVPLSYQQRQHQDPSVDQDDTNSLNSSRSVSASSSVSTSKQKRTKRRSVSRKAHVSHLMHAASSIPGLRDRLHQALHLHHRGALPPWK